MNYHEKQKNLLNERNKKIIELDRKGLSKAEIAKIIGIHRANVYKVLKAVDK